MREVCSVFEDFGRGTQQEQQRARQIASKNLRTSKNQRKGEFPFFGTMAKVINGF
jgi:hypothetical protein